MLSGIVTSCLDFDFCRSLLGKGFLFVCFVFHFSDC